MGKSQEIRIQHPSIPNRTNIANLCKLGKIKHIRKEIKLASVKNLRKAVEDSSHPALRDLVANHTFVGKLI